MPTRRLGRSACLLLIAWPVAAQRPSATGLLAKAREAFERNRDRQDHWNWTTMEERAVVDRSGHTAQSLPSVTVESVIRKDGRRCNAVLTWGDGVEPYKLNEDADARCAGQEPTEPPFRMDALLQSAKVKMGPRSPTAITLQIEHDKSRVHDPQHDVRCTASIQATLHLDPATFFPMHLEGQVVDSGCEGETTQELHYGEAPPERPFHRLLRKGTAFRLEYALQPDKFGNPSNSYWIAVQQHWSRPFQQNANGLVYSNRLFKLDRNIPNPALILDAKTTAREFGSSSEIRVEGIDKVPQQTP
jgi:hypothetical protein